MSVASPRGVPVELADGPHVLRFNINRLIEVEEHFGGFDAMQQALDTKPISASRYLVWASIGGEFTLEQVGELLDGVAFKPIIEALAQALAQAFSGSAVSEGTAGSDPTPVAPSPSENS